MSRKVRTAFTTLTIALALTACSPSEQDTTQAPAEAPAATESPAITDASVAATPKAPAPEAPAEQPTIEPTPAVAPAPTTPPVPEHRRCLIDQAADGGSYEITGIKVDDKDGGLTVRSSAGYSYRQIGLFFNGEVIGTYLDDPQWPSCLVTADNNVWWEIHSPQLPSSGWVNARYLSISFADMTSPVHFDGHGDCVLLPDLPDRCIVVFRSDGGIYNVEAFSDEIYHELLYACLAQDFMEACDVLSFEGQDIGTHLLLLSDDEALKMCSEDGARGKVGCWEVDRRSAGSELGI